MGLAAMAGLVAMAVTVGFLVPGAVVFLAMAAVAYYVITQSVLVHVLL